MVQRQPERSGDCIRRLTAEHHCWSKEESMAGTWVVAGGFGEIDLAEVFLRVGVALIGPGALGDFFDRRSAYERELASSPQDWRMVREFAEDVAVGDRILLRRRATRTTDDVLALGKVIGPYRHEPIFQEVDVWSWDLQHCRRVRWLQLPTPESLSLPPNRFSRLVNPEILTFVDNLWTRHNGP